MGRGVQNEPAHWMAVHAHLKNEFTEDEKYHNLMRWLINVLSESFKINCYLF